VRLRRMKISVVLGTRPEIIKMSPVIRELENRKLDFFIIHTGQHYSYNLDGVFFEQLNLPRARYNLEVGSGSHAEETSKILLSVEKVLLEENPDIVLVEGDTNSVLGGTLAAVKLHVKIGHVEAGLRSYDRQMPEEINRLLTDHCSDYLFAPTGKARDILLGEAVPEDKIFVTGNTIVDAVHQNLEIARELCRALDDLQLKSGEYFLVTLHRQENADNPSRFADILKGLELVADRYRMPVIYPVHPRSRKRIGEYGLNPENIRLVDPVDFLSFLQLESHARLVLTDSGGVQEESCILGTPCVTLRDNTERPETIDVGANILAGAMPEKISECSETMLGRDNNWSNPFGDGQAGTRIVDILEARL
jgi:UDP-N-acetylglucosamine 2-epimerase (non-hydrolysing)